MSLCVFWGKPRGVPRDAQLPGASSFCILFLRQSAQQFRPDAAWSHSREHVVTGGSPAGLEGP